MAASMRYLYVSFRKTVLLVRTSGAQSILKKVAAALRRGGIGELRRTYYAYMARSRAGDIQNQSPDNPAAQPHRRPRKPVEGEIYLDPDHGIDESAWLAYIEKLYQQNLLTPPQKSARPLPSGKLVVLVDDTVGAGDAVITHSSLSKLALSSEITVEIRWLRDSLSSAGATAKSQLGVSIDRSNIAEMIAANDLVLFLKSGDEVRTEILPALEFFNCFDSYFSLIDLYLRDSSRIFPLLLHGVDCVHGLYCDYFHSRYAAKGSAVLGAIHDLGSAWTIRDMSLALLRTIANTNVLKTAHVSFPLICIRESLSDIRSVRNSLLHVEHKEKPRNIDCAPAVSVIICTKDNAHLLRQLVRSLLLEQHVKEVIIVSNNSTNPYAIELLNQLSANERVAVLRYDQAFNFSRQCNLGAEHSTGDYLLFINDDIVPVSDGWLDTMIGMVKCNPRRIIGPLLLYPNEAVQHGGMYIGFKGLAGHTLRYAKIPDGGYNFMLSAPRKVSCLTGACLLISQGLFDDLNGFDPMLATYIQDVDLSLRALYSGAELIFDPRAILLHMESISLRPDLAVDSVQLQRRIEFDYYSRRWAGRTNRDQWANPLFHPDDESLCRLYVPPSHH